MSAKARAITEAPAEEVVEKPSFRSLICMGPFCFDESYTLQVHDRVEGAARTRWTARLRFWSEVPLLGRVLTGWIGRPTAASVVRHSLEAMRGHCEART